MGAKARLACQVPELGGGEATTPASPRPLTWQALRTRRYRRGRAWVPLQGREGIALLSLIALGW
jgi:hypothetical protein